MMGETPLSTATSGLEPLQLDDNFNYDLHLGLGREGPPNPSPVATTARGRQAIAGPAAQAIPTPHSRARSRLLAMADDYLRSGSLHQAIEMYFHLMGECPGTAEADQAEERILEVADYHERAGEMRLARAIYERLA